MSKKKMKKHDLADLQKYMHLLDVGHSFEHIHATYGINTDQLKVLRSRYQQYGLVGLQKKRKYQG